MKIILIISLLITARCWEAFSQNLNWSSKSPFAQNVFIENKGQFAPFEEKEVGAPILFYSRLGSVHIYFTSTSIVFRHDSVINSEEREDGQEDFTTIKEKEEKNIQLVPHFLEMQWKNSNPNCKVEVKDMVNDYYTYPDFSDMEGKSGIRANAWKTLIYKDLYPGIDFTYYFPQNKEGFKYDITVHPGADISLVKIKYSGADIKLLYGNLDITCKNYHITDHAPIASDDMGNVVAASFIINKDEISFKAGLYDKNKTLTIDPWTTSSLFNGVDKAYDVGYDNAGNVYITGGGTATTPCQLKKYNGSGLLQWTYTATWPVSNPGAIFYGDLTVDKRSGMCYFGNGVGNSGSQGQMKKVNTLGSVVASMNVNNCNFTDLWRLEFDYCNNLVVLGLGTPYAGCLYNTATIDTNLSSASFNRVNTLGITSFQNFTDVTIMALDQAGAAYMATSKSSGTSPYNNYLFRVPLPSLSPTTYKVPDGYSFDELNSIMYYPYLAGYSLKSNGYNGMLASPTMLVTYDGAILKKWVSSTGAFVSSATVSSLPQHWGGLDWNCKKDIYVSNNNKVDIYDSTLAFIGTASVFADTIFDVRIDENLGKLYVCGRGFVASANIPINTFSISVTSTAHNPTCACIDTASVQPSCGTAPFTYQWSNGATTQTVYNLCPGTYSVTVKDAMCLPKVATATVFIPGSLGAISANINSVNPTCTIAGSASANITGGTSPFTYSWNTTPVQTSQTATGLVAGTYTVIITDAQGCSATAIITLTGNSSPSVSATSTQVICNSSNGTATANPSGGSGAPYSYNWNNGQTSQTATGLSVGNYTVTIADANGCTGITTVSVTSTSVFPIANFNSGPVCLGSITQFTDQTTGNPNTWNWNFGDGSINSTAQSPSHTYTAAGTYSVSLVVTNANGCSDTIILPVTVDPVPAALFAPSSVCLNDSISFVDNSTGNITQWNWNFGNSNYSNQQNPTYAYATPGTYTVTLTVTTASGCKDSIKHPVTINPLPIVSVPGTTICIGQAATLTANGGTNYLWSTGATTASIATSPASTSTYSVIAFNSFGCSDSASVTLAVVPPPVASASSDTICSGQFASLAASGGGSYLWNNGSTTSSISVSPPVSSNYSVIVSIGMCSDTAYSSVLVNPSPVISLGNNQTICAGQSITLDAGNPGASYMWSTAQTTQTIDISAPGNYWVIVALGNCLAMDTIQTFTAPGISLPDSSLCTTTPIVLDPGPGASSYYWSTGNTTQSISVDTAGTYYVTVMFGNCAATAVSNITGLPGGEGALYVPNAFTPNGDFLNEYFTAKGLGIISFDMTVFDRWGNLIFDSDDINKGWNGTIEGGHYILKKDGSQVAQEDVYIWRIKYTTECFPKLEKQKMGHVSLVK